MDNLEDKITQAWYQNKRWIFLFYPVELIYRCIIYIRNKLYKNNILKSSHPGVPVIVVGNISVGGTGKTPVVIELVNYLTKKGWNPGIVSRGYGGELKQYPFIVDESTPVESCGDEAILLQRNSNATIAIDPDRSRGAIFLVKQGCDIIVTDDGLQHLGLKRDFEIVVVDGQRGFGNKHLLPVGPLREAISRLDNSDFILTNGDVNHCPEHPSSDCFEVVPTTLIDVNTRQHFPLSWLKNKQHHAIAGIGNPQRFFSLLEKLGGIPICHPFPDHHNYKISDIPNDRKSLVVTEKDAVKLEGFHLQDCLYLKIQASLPTSFFNHIDKFLKTFPKNTKANS